MGTELTGLSFIVPAFNEEESILETLCELDNELTRLSVPFEIIVVDDGSTDRVDTTLGTGVPDQVTIIRHPINAGYGAALKTGIKFAQYEWVGIVDADGSYEIGGLSRLVKQAELGFDMVVGRRENIRMTDSFIKGLMRKTLHIFVRVLVDHDMKDLNSGFRIMRRASVLEFLPFLCSTFSFTTSLTILFLERGLFVCYESTKYSPRVGESKVRHFRDSLRALQMIIQGVSFFNPLKTFALLGVLMVVSVCIPAMVFATIGFKTLSGYYMIFGSVVILLFAGGIIGDIVRVSSIRAAQSTFNRRTELD